MEDNSVKIGYIQTSQLRLSKIDCFHSVFGGFVSRAFIVRLVVSGQSSVVE